MERIEQCPVCGGNAFSPLFECTDHVALGDRFMLTRCNACTFLFTNPRPAVSEIGPYYQSDRYISHASNKAGFSFIYRLYDLVRNYSIGSKLRLIKKYHKSGKMLDLGCGLGYFLHGAIEDKTFEAEGADVSTEAIDYVGKRFGYHVMNESELDAIPSGKYDVITQWHVLEHVHALNKRMEQLDNMLSAGGTMFIAVPNSASWDASHYREFWDGYDVPRHLYHFNPESFRQLMDKHGFKVVDTKPLWFDAPYISMRSETHQGHGLVFLRGAFWGAVSTLMAIFTGNHSSLLFVVKKNR